MQQIRRRRDVGSLGVGRRPARRAAGTTNLVIVINAATAAVTAVYTVTRSELLTALASALIALLAIVIVGGRREG